MTEKGRRLFLVGVVALAIAAFVAQVLSLGAARRQPRYDEVSYLALAREYNRLGGAWSAIRCHLDGRCREDNRNPAYELALQAFAHDRPSFYADAKLVTLATALLLLLLAGVIAWRAFSPAVGVATVALLVLLPTLAEISSGVLADVLYAGVLFACVRAIGLALERGPVAWLGAGAMIGLAYLTKGNGHLAFLGLITAGLAVRGRRLLVGPHVYAAAAGFVAVTWFLLWRNTVFEKNPFHNFNDHAIWLDGWSDVWRKLRTPEWNQIGLRWYLQRHSPLALAWRVVKGLGQALGVLIYTAGPGLARDTRGHLQPVAVVLRAAAGVAVLTLAARGLLDRYRTGRRAEVLAVLHVGAWILLAFSVGAQGVGGVATRFVLPLAVLCIPYAAHALVGLLERQRSVTRSPRAWLPVLLLFPFVLELAWFAPALGANPRRAFDVPSGWAQTSGWLRANLRRGERFATASGSLYSTWDNPLPDPDARWIYLFDQPAAEMLRDLDEGKPASIEPHRDGPPLPIEKILVDRADLDANAYRDKLAGQADEQGPLTFVGWPRCFADGERPSRFLIYCRP